MRGKLLWSAVSGDQPVVTRSSCFKRGKDKSHGRGCDGTLLTSRQPEKPRGEGQGKVARLHFQNVIKRVDSARINPLVRFETSKPIRLSHMSLEGCFRLKPYSFYRETLSQVSQTPQGCVKGHWCGLL